MIREEGWGLSTFYFGLSTLSDGTPAHRAHLAPGGRVVSFFVLDCSCGDGNGLGFGMKMKMKKASQPRTRNSELGTRN